MFTTKKMIILSVVLVLLLTSCNRNNYSPEPTNNDSSVNYNDFMPITGTYALTEQGAYTVVENRIYYLDNEDKWNLLCFDPACVHSSSECSSYLNNISEIFTHEGYIYYLSRYINNEFTLSRMNLMGKEREEITKISIENPTLNANYAYQISANNILIRFRSIDTSKDYILTTLYTTTLDKNNDVKIVATGDVNEFRVTKYWLFYTERSEDNGTYLLKGYNFSTEEYITIFPNYTEASEYVATIYTPDPETFYWFQADKGFMMMRKEDMKHITLKESDPSYQQGTAVYDNKYIYLVNSNPLIDKTLKIPLGKRGLYIYGHDGEYIDFISTTSLVSNISYAFETQDKVFFREISGSMTPNFYYISKEDIGSGNLAWSLVEMEVD